MNNKVKTVNGCSALMRYLDSLKKEQVEILREAEEAVNESKVKLHAAKIQSNRISKEVELVQSVIDEELKAQVIVEQDASAAWDFKSTIQLTAEAMQHV